MTYLKEFGIKEDDTLESPLDLRGCAKERGRCSILLLGRLGILRDLSGPIVESGKKTKLPMGTKNSGKLLRCLKA